MVQIFEQVVSDIENKDRDSNFFVLAANAAVEYYYFGKQKMCKIKVEPF